MKIAYTRTNVEPIPATKMEKEFINKLDASINSGMKRTFFSHYTSFYSVLEEIIINRYILLNRIDKVKNDPYEKLFILGNQFDEDKPIDYPSIFVGCFTYDKDESDYYWKDYGKLDKEKNTESVKIEYCLSEKINLKNFPYNIGNGLFDQEREIVISHGEITNDTKSYQKITDNYLYDNKYKLLITSLDVLYYASDEELKNSLQTMKNLILRKFIGTIKSTKWKEDNEIRILAQLFCFPCNSSDATSLFPLENPPDRIFIPIDFNKIKLRIVVNKFASDEYIKKITNLCTKNLDGVNYEIIKSNLK